MGVRWGAACLVLTVLCTQAAGQGQGVGEERWSRPATPERRQGDWVPLTCPHCRPNSGDQGSQASDSLASVLTPPPRAEEARLLPPPPPPDPLFQQAASGFLQTYTQQQPPPRKPHQQFLQETTGQSLNSGPLAQFLKSKNQPFLQEPSSAFQPPAERQPHLLPFNQQQFVSDQPYLNQPLLLGPHFVAPSFFPQPSLPLQNIQPLRPAQLQPQSPISPNTVPVKQNFELPAADRPVFVQQITAGTQSSAQPVSTQTAAPQLQYAVNDTGSQKDDGNEEIQLLYVPVETLNQRARNLGRQKSLVNQQVTGTETNTFTSPDQNYAFSTRKPQVEQQEHFSTQTSKPQYNFKQKQQSEGEDQQQFNTQTHTVRQQFSAQPQTDQFQQTQPENSEVFKLITHNSKQQYNFKPVDQVQQQFHQDAGAINPQFNVQQTNLFQQQPPVENSGSLAPQQLNIRQHETQFQQQFQQELPSFKTQTFNPSQQFASRPQEGVSHFQQQTAPHQDSFGGLRSQSNLQQFSANQNAQFQQQLLANQQAFAAIKDQPYVNQPLQFNQEIGKENIQPQPVSPQQTQIQQQFDQQTVRHQTASPVTQTRAPDTFTSQHTPRSRFRNQQQDEIKYVQQQQHQINQFTRKFPQDYQQTASVSTTPSQVAPVESVEQVQGASIRPNQPKTVESQDFSSRQQFNQQEYYNQQHEVRGPSQLHSDQVSSIAPAATTTIPPSTTLAPNQPPLSVYMETTEDTKVNDVLRLLKNAKTIQVLDTVGPDSPQVFVGPSNLKPPTGYIKFELPYLNSLENNRVERKVDKLPFFVAPLNFNPPPGYSKIPFPAPHIGSVVVSNVTILKTALHEKPYETEPVTASSTERYSDPYTLPAEIPAISPQLPSLINSLQDEIYSNPTAASFPSSTPETTTVYTTPAYRGRGSSRGSYRGSTSETSAAPQSRRPQSRTRRPYDGRPHSRRVTTTTTTEEPSTEAPVQQFTPQPDEFTYNSESYISQNTETPTLHQTLQPNTQQSHPSTTIFDEQFVANNFNQGQFSFQQQQPVEQNVRQGDFTNTQNVNQYQQNQGLSHNTYTEEAIAQTPPVPNQNSQQEDQSFKGLRTNSVRRDPSRPHQRFRGRQRTTTTTEANEQPDQTVENQYNQQTDVNVNYQNIPRNQQRTHHQSRLVENTHFTASVPERKYSIQTERADTGIQTTERLASAQNEEQFVQQNFKNNQFEPQFNPRTHSHDASIPQSSKIRHDQGIHQHLSQQQFSQFDTTQDQLNFNISQPQSDFTNLPIQQNNQADFAVNQFQQGFQRELPHQPVNSQGSQANFNQHVVDQAYLQGVNGGEQNYYSQEKQLGEQARFQGQIPNNQQQFINDQQTFSPVQEQVKNPSIVNQANHEQYLSSAGKFEHAPEITATQPAEVPAQTQAPTTTKIEEEPDVQQYNQQRLVKYNRPSPRTPVNVDTTNDQQSTNTRRGQHHFQSHVESTDSSTTDDATTRASLVRVRGRVRSRQRGSTRTHPATTETPNYPTAYLNKQRNNQEREENHDYSSKKRVNYNRQPYHSVRNSIKETETTQSITETYGTTEHQQASERFPDYTDPVTTTESSTSKPSRRYQHILNRNKVRRVRPTDAPTNTRSAGTTKFLVPTTPPPLTRLPSTRARIRRPGSTTTSTTTEYPQANPNWNEKDSFAPSAGSNEILEPLYQTRDKAQQPFGFQRNPVASQKTSPKPSAASTDDDDYWNQAVTIQQSTSFDFKPDASHVTPPTFQQSKTQFQTPEWDGQIELQDGNYFDVFNQQRVSKDPNDQTPFSSDHQKVVFKEIKSKRPVGKDNQYNEKTYEVKRPIAEEDEENVPKVYPVYRELIKPAETIRDETSQVVTDIHTDEEKSLHEKDGVEHHHQNEEGTHNEEPVSFRTEDEVKEGVLKRKISATIGKKGVRRRGSWVRVRVRKPQPDMFETAESQNLASLSENSIPVVTKTVGEKGPWTPEPSAEPTTTTTTAATTEPAETINFEEALTNMLKEFITNPEETKEETDIESTNKANITVATDESKQAEENLLNNTPEDQVVNDQVTNKESKPESEEKIKLEVKTVLPEVTTEVFTPEPTTIFQPIENAETTTEPEVTTSQNDEIPNTRVLGTSTTTEISLETEICYRGRCVKTKKADGETDLLPME